MLRLYVHYLSYVIEGFRRGRNVAYMFLGCSPASIFGV
jgi:hypothetical protein